MKVFIDDFVLLCTYSHLVVFSTVYICYIVTLTLFVKFRKMRCYHSYKPILIINMQPVARIRKEMRSEGSTLAGSRFVIVCFLYLFQKCNILIRKAITFLTTDMMTVNREWWLLEYLLLNNFHSIKLNPVL